MKKVIIENEKYIFEQILKKDCNFKAHSYCLECTTNIPNEPDEINSKVYCYIDCRVFRILGKVSDVLKEKESYNPLLIDYIEKLIKPNEDYLLMKEYKNI